MTDVIVNSWYIFAISYFWLLKTFSLFVSVPESSAIIILAA